MDPVLALLPVPAYAAVIAAVAILANRLLAGDDTGLSELFRIELDPPRPGRAQEDEPVRWNVERLRRPTRTESTPSAAAMPTGAAGSLEGVCLT
jgi:hypothetical protein